MKNRETFKTSLQEDICDRFFCFFRREERASAKVLRDYVTRINTRRGYLCISVLCALDSGNLALYSSFARTRRTERLALLDLARSRAAKPLEL